MAAVAPTRASVGKWDTFTWTGVTESDTFTAVRVEGSPKAATMQVSGTFGSATVIMQGSNDGTTFVALNDSAGSAISHTAAGGSELGYGWPYMRPSASGGSSQSLTVIMAVLVE